MAVVIREWLARLACAVRRHDPLRRADMTRLSFETHIRNDGEVVTFPTLRTTRWHWECRRCGTILGYAGDTIPHLAGRPS